MYAADTLERPVRLLSWKVAALWAVSVLLVWSLIALFQRNAQLNELTSQGSRLQTLATQRAGQHDAHLTALSAVAIASAGQRQDLFLDVAGTVMRFYPRIEAVLLVPLDGADAAMVAGDASEGLALLVADAARTGGPVPALLADPSTAGRYLVVKRSPNSDDAIYGLALIVGAAGLVADDSGFWDAAGVARRLLMPDGTPLLGPAAPRSPAYFADVLASASQPLRVEAGLSLGFADLLPPKQMFAGLLAVTLAGLAIQFARRQRSRVRAAERRAELSGLEAQLTHASRVNGLGEMASGIAHELTQPLTAILAQAQAARRMLAREPASDVIGSLDEIIAQTRRAADILDRLRLWTRPTRRTAERVDLRRCARSVQSLLAQYAARDGIALVLDEGSLPLIATADPVEIEQVIFNLAKNGLEAALRTNGEREVKITLRSKRDHAIIDVTDTGPGVDPALRDRLFSPFVTTREDGTGLGLALSQRLAERAGGEVVFVDQKEGACFRVTLPLAGQEQRAAE